MLNCHPVMRDISYESVSLVLFYISFYLREVGGGMGYEENMAGLFRVLAPSLSPCIDCLLKRGAHFYLNDSISVQRQLVLLNEALNVFVHLLMIVCIHRRNIR